MLENNFVNRLGKVLELLSSYEEEDLDPGSRLNGYDTFGTGLSKFKCKIDP
jgi:hypothetical protein